MRRPAPAVSARNYRLSSRRIASTIWKRLLCASPGGTRRIRTPMNGITSPARPASPTACARRSKTDPTTEMGRYVVKVPDIGEGMTEAEIVAWHVAPGQVIREEDPLVDVMTDKATVELPAPVAGTVIEIHVRPGERRAVGSELVILDVLGEGNAVEDVPESAFSKTNMSPAQPLTPT